MERPMRRLVLLRHAKADRPPGVDDRERPLDPRGKRAAPAVGARLAGEGIRPDLALVSPATRTRETWAAIEAGAGWSGTAARIVPEIYEAPPAQILAAIHAAPDEAGTLVVVGHNPGIARLAAALAGEGPRDGLAHLSEGFPTAAFAVIAFDAPAWAAVAPGSGRLERFVRPRDIDPALAG